MTLLVVTSPAHGEGFCTGLKIALNDSANLFTSLRGDFSFSSGSYRAKLTMGELRKCNIVTDEIHARFKCEHKFDLPDDEPHAKSLFSRSAAKIKECLGPDVNEQSNDLGERIEYEYVPTRDVISLKYDRVVIEGGNVYFHVSVGITSRDPTKQ